MSNNINENDALEINPTLLTDNHKVENIMRNVTPLQENVNTQNIEQTMTPPDHAKNDGTVAAAPSEEEHTSVQTDHLLTKNTAEEDLDNSQKSGSTDIFDQLIQAGAQVNTPEESIRVLRELAIRKPQKDEWVFCHGELQLPAFIYAPSGQRTVYLVFPEVAEKMGSVCKPVRLTLTTARTGTYFVWPVPIPSQTSPYSAHTSAFEAAAQAKHEWIRIAWEDSAYKVSKRRSKCDAPSWPEDISSVKDMLKLAGKTSGVEVISEADHPVVRELLGED